MLNINFVPEEYVQSKDSARTNLMYLMLMLIVMLGLGGSFMMIRMRQNDCKKEELAVDAKMAKAKEAMVQFQQLQEKRKIMLKTALTTSELIEPVNRSVLMAALTNKLPDGTSFLRLNIVQKEPEGAAAAAVPIKPAGQYDAAKQKPAEEAVSKEKLLETSIEIEGFATSDLQVAEYIRKLINSNLLRDVALVESREQKVKDVAFRQFKLTAMLNKNVHLTSKDIEELKKNSQGGENTVTVNIKGVNNEQ